MNDDLEQLWQRAKQATPGRWCAVGAIVENEDDHHPDICDTSYPCTFYTSSDYAVHAANAAYIASAQPKVIKALIREIRALRKQVANG